MVAEPQLLVFLFFIEWYYCSSILIFYYHPADLWLVVAGPQLLVFLFFIEWYYCSSILIFYYHPADLWLVVAGPQLLVFLFVIGWCYCSVILVFYYHPAADLWMVVADPHRPGHESSYYPGDVNFRCAKVVLVNKANTAEKVGLKLLHFIYIYIYIIYIYIYIRKILRVSVVSGFRVSVVLGSTLVGSSYYPGDVNFRCAKVVLVNKANTAEKVGLGFRVSVV